MKAAVFVHAFLHQLSRYLDWWTGMPQQHAALPRGELHHQNVDHIARGQRRNHKQSAVLL